MEDNVKKIYDNFEVLEKIGDKDSYIFRENNKYLKIKSEDEYKALLELDSIYNKLNKNVSMKNFYSCLIKFILNSETKFNKLKDIIGKSNKMLIYRSIYDVFLEDKLEIGDITIYNLNKNKKYLENKNKKYKSNFFENLNSECIVEIKIEAVDSEAAFDIADKKIEEFINFLCFFHNENKVKKLFFKNINFQENQLLISDKRIVENMDKKIGFPIDLDYFKSQLLKDKILNILSKESNSKLEDSIKNCIIWVGESLRDKKHSSSFLKLVIALESLFFMNGGVITPSILSFVSESTALILGENYEERIRIEKNIKDIYSKRSSITHSGKQDEKLYIQKYYLFEIIRKVIKVLLSEEYLECKNKEDVVKKLKVIKYS